MQEVSLYISVFCVCGGKGIITFLDFKIISFFPYLILFFFSFLMIFPPPGIGTEDAFVMFMCVCVYVYCRINNRM